MMKKKSRDGFHLLLNDVPHDKMFYSVNGSIFKNLQDLKNALKKMDSGTFQHHVNKDKNDFANWIYDVVGDTTLANSLRKVYDPRDTLKKLTSRIAYIKKRIKDLGGKK